MLTTTLTAPYVAHCAEAGLDAMVQLTWSVPVVELEAKKAEAGKSITDVVVVLAVMVTEFGPAAVLTAWPVAPTRVLLTK